VGEVEEGQEERKGGWLLIVVLRGSLSEEPGGSQHRMRAAGRELANEGQKALSGLLCCFGLKRVGGLICYLASSATWLSSNPAVR